MRLAHSFNSLMDESDEDTTLVRLLSRHTALHLAAQRACTMYKCDHTGNMCRSTSERPLASSRRLCGCDVHKASTSKKSPDLCLVRSARTRLGASWAQVLSSRGNSSHAAAVEAFCPLAPSTQGQTQSNTAAYMLLRDDRNGVRQAEGNTG